MRLSPINGGALVALCALLVVAPKWQTTSAVAAAVQQEENNGYKKAWNDFKRQYNKTYEQPEEEERRMNVFLDNLQYLESQSLKATPNLFEQGLNQLSDLTPEEINKSRCGFRLPGGGPESNFFETSARSSQDILLETILEAVNASSLDQLATLNNVTHQEPDQVAAFKNFSINGKPQAAVTRAWYENLLTRESLDYRELGVVSRVKDQGNCGSCWAFSTTGALESYLARRFGRQVLLSEQNLVDCSRRYGNRGCQGGLMNAALRYVRDHGIMANRDYPYAAADNPCQFKPSLSVMRARGSLVLPRGNEALLRVALALSGPLPVSIDAGARSFHSYKSGVYDDTVCRNSRSALNHAVLLVGYGTSPSAGDYWILKNSWGRSWGDNGYIKMARNRNNLCGVASFAVLPLH